MTAGNKPSIAVIGAGMGGLAAAGALRHVGLDVDVYEQAAQFSRIGAGIQVTPNAVKVLRETGVGPALLARAFEARSQLTRDSVTGEVLRDLVMPAEQYGAPYLCIHRGDLHSALLGVLPPERIHHGKKLVGLTPRPSGVLLSFADGSTVLADAVVGADGMHSVVREQIVGPVSAVYSGRSAFRSVLRTDWLPRDLAGPSRTMWLAEDRNLLAYHTVSDGSETCVVTSQPDAGEWMKDSWPAAGDLEQFRAAYDTFHGDVKTMLAACTECHITGTSYLPPLPRWSDGRVVLLGDACHTMLPRMAQGAAMAMEDAAVLARCIAGVNGEDFEGAFARYEAHRKPRTTLLHEISLDARAAGRRGDKDMGWLYGYEAWTISLDGAPVLPESVATAT